jgi:hypothetical protein
MVLSARCTSAAEAGGFISFTAGLKTCSTPPWDTVNPKKVLVPRRIFEKKSAVQGIELENSYEPDKRRQFY